MRPLLALACLLAAAPALPEVDARVTAAEGEVDVRFEGSEDWVPADPEVPLAVGDSVRTGSAATAEIAFGDQTVYELQPGSTLSIGKLDADAVRFKLDVGSLLLHLKKLLSAKTVEVETKGGVAAVLGTELAVQADADGGASVAVFEGEVRFQPAGGEAVTVKKDEELGVRDGKVERRAKPERLAALRERLGHLRSRRIAVRREWKAMPAADRAALRKKLHDERDDRRLKRGMRLEEQRKQGALKPAAKPQEKREAARERPQKGKPGKGGGRPARKQKRGGRK